MGLSSITKNAHSYTSTWELVNKQKPIWLKKSQDIKREEYATFFKSISNDWEDHLAVKHFSIEGQLDFKSLLFDQKKKRDNIKLYVRRVFILDTSDELISEYLSFILGVVDADDLPLNISREMLQQNKILKVIRKNNIKKSLELFIDLSETYEDFNIFYEIYSKNIKLGIHEDNQNRSKLIEIVRYFTTKSQEKLSTFSEYTTRFKNNQKSIFYITGESKKAIEDSPLIEKAKVLDIEVILMLDAIDEYCITQIKEYNRKKLVNVSKEGLKLEEKVEKIAIFEEMKTKYVSFCSRIKQIIGDKIEKVEITQRLIFSPCVIVTGEYGWSANMERIMKAQVLRDRSMGNYITSRKFFEINPENTIIDSIKCKLKRFDDDITSKEMLRIVFEISLISSGFSIEYPNLYAKNIYRLIYLGYVGETNFSHKKVKGGSELQLSILGSRMEEVD